MIGIWLIIIGMAVIGLISGDDAAVYAALILAAIAVISERLNR